MATAVMVTAIVSMAVFNINSARRPGGTASVVPVPMTWNNKLTGGMSAGRSATPAATHQPQPPRRRICPTSGRRAVSGPAVNSHQAGLGHQTRGLVEHTGEVAQVDVGGVDLGEGWHSVGLGDALD